MFTPAAAKFGTVRLHNSIKICSTREGAVQAANAFDVLRKAISGKDLLVSGLAAQQLSSKSTLWLQFHRFCDMAYHSTCPVVACSELIWSCLEWQMRALLSSFPDTVVNGSHGTL